MNICMSDNDDAFLDSSVLVYNIQTEMCRLPAARHTVRATSEGTQSCLKVAPIASYNSSKHDCEEVY